VVLPVIREAPVLREGRSTVGGLEMGAYLMEVFEGAKLRRVTTVEMDPRTPDTHVTISIPPASEGAIPNRAPR
jgi:hypothetical protein